MRELSYVIFDVASFEKFSEQLLVALDEHGRVEFKKPKLGTVTRSREQNSLFHIWIRQAAAHYNKIPIEDITDQQVKDMKDSIKRSCLIDNPDYRSWLIIDKYDAIGKRHYEGFQTSVKWEAWEMFQVMFHLQIKSQFEGLYLESTGDYKDMVESNA